MTILEKYDKVSAGTISGFCLHFIILVFVFFFAKGDPSLTEWLSKIKTAGIETHIISLCVFPHIVIFLLFNQLDMLRAARGVLGVTIFWAIIVFAVYFFL